MIEMEEFINALKLYQDGKLSLDEVEKIFSPLDQFHDFWHYISDQDIREKDLEYKKMQKDELSKFINALETGDYDSATQITFLSPHRAG